MGPMFSTGWRRFLVHFKRRYLHGLRDALITLLIYAAMWSLTEHVGNFILNAYSKDTMLHDLGLAALLLVSFVLAMSILFTSLESLMTCNAEQHEFRRKMGFKE